MNNLLYYFVIEVNVNNQTNIQHFPELSDDFGLPQHALFSSSDYLDYQVCVNKIGYLLGDKIDVLQHRGEKDKFKMYWEKNTFEDAEDSETSKWRSNEAIKIVVNDDHNKWLFKASVFFKEDTHHIHPEPSTMQ